MTGGGRCQRRRKSMAGGGRGAAESKKSDSKIKIPNLKPEITEKPLDSPKIRKVPPRLTVEFDLYAQAYKALSYRSPFDSVDSQAPAAFVSTANNLPSGVSHLLGRHSDSRKRQKKLHSGPEKKSSGTGGTRGTNIWIEAEEYFRELNVEDVERIEKLQSVGFSCHERCFLVPSLNNDGNLCDRHDVSHGILDNACDKDRLKQENGVEAIGNGTSTEEENGPRSMDIDGDDVEKKDLEVIEEVSGEKRQGSCKDSLSFSGVEWLLGSRSKVYLTTERPSKKRKIFGRDAGLEKLHVARPVEGVESVCHYCNYGDTSDPLNRLIKCSSCSMVVHQRCYGVQDDVDGSWLCSWCKWKNALDLNSETPCLLCPKQGGALKPVKKSGSGSENEGAKMVFAHLFCCQWAPELYLENTRTMEPIMNIDEVTDTRKKLICYLCKVKCGACVRCSTGSCRTSFHPLCAREARHRMEIWGKLGTDEVELRAFCSKHSEVESDSGCQDTEDIPLTADQDLRKQTEVALGKEECPDDKQKLETHSQKGDASRHVIKCSVDSNDSDADASIALKLPVILKKLIDLGKVDAKDLASEIGVSPDSLDTVLSDCLMAPEIRCKVLRWLKSHAHVGNLIKLKVKIKSPVARKAVVDAAEGVDAVSVEESSLTDSVPVKSVPPRRRTKSSMRLVKDDKSAETLGDDSHNPSREPLPNNDQEILIDLGQHQGISANNSVKIEDEITALLRCLSEDGLVEEARKCKSTGSSLLIKEEGRHTSYVHPIVHRRFTHTKNDTLGKTSFCHSAGLRGQEASQLEAASTSDHCCNSNALQATSDESTRCDGMNSDQLVKARNLGLLELSPVDEVEGELIYYQQRLLDNAVSRKRISDELISRVVKGLSLEVDAARKRKWDDVLVNQYIHELREAKKQGRKERRHREAQAVLAAATAAAAASSRVSSLRKDNLEESLQLELNKQTTRSAVTRSSLETDSGSVRLASTDQPRTCDVCRRPETVLNTILVCSSCKVAVHLDCYRSVRSTAGPWHCELCEHLFSSQGSEAMGANSWEKPYFVAECGLCGGTAGAFRKTADSQWIHAFCAEWVLESTYRRGQLNPINGLDNISKGIDTCAICHRKQGVCLKCCYGHCQTMFHPTCARSAGYYLTVKTNVGKLQHKAYCEKHSVEQKAKAETQRHEVDELKSLKQVRVELERLRLLCERIVKREKLKRELALCSQSILATSRDSVLSALAHHPYYQTEVSSESATTYKSGSEIVQRSDDITVDSTVAGKRRVKLPISVDNDQKTEDSTTSSQNVFTLKPPPAERVSFSGKHIPQRHLPSSRSPTDTTTTTTTNNSSNHNHNNSVEKQSKHRKVSVTFSRQRRFKKSS